MRARVLISAGFALATAGFAVATLLVYHFRPTAGTVFLGLGWIAILCTGFLLVKTVSTFDLRVGADVLGDLSADRRLELDREKKLLIKAIKEVEFDRDSGKLDGGEAAGAISRYRARAVEILRFLDEGAARQYEAVIEKELVRRLAAAGGLPDASATAVAAVVAEAPDTEAVAPRTCAACESRNDLDAAFCKKCGAKLENA